MVVLRVNPDEEYMGIDCSDFNATSIERHLRFTRPCLPPGHQYEQAHVWLQTFQKALLTGRDDTIIVFYMFKIPIPLVRCYVI